MGAAGDRAEGCLLCGGIGWECNAVPEGLRVWARDIPCPEGGLT